MCKDRIGSLQTFTSNVDFGAYDQNEDISYLRLKHYLRKIWLNNRSINLNQLWIDGVCIR